MPAQSQSSSQGLCLSSRSWVRLLLTCSLFLRVVVVVGVGVLQLEREGEAEGEKQVVVEVGVLLQALGAVPPEAEGGDLWTQLAMRQMSC